jgi:hypothetical protein
LEEGPLPQMGMVAHTCDFSTQGIDAGGSRVGDQPGPQYETLGSSLLSEDNMSFWAPSTPQFTKFPQRHHPSQCLFAMKESPAPPAIILPFLRCETRRRGWKLASSQQPAPDLSTKASLSTQLLVSAGPSGRSTNGLLANLCTSNTFPTTRREKLRGTATLS